MYIVIFKEGNQQQPLQKTTFEQAFEMPGEKYIFDIPYKVHPSSELYIDGGIWCYDGEKHAHFIHDGYHLVSIDYINPNWADYSIEIVFSDRNHKIVAILFRKSNIAYALTKAVREIILASKFSSWEEYLKNKADINEIDRLTTENAALKKEIEELRQKTTLGN